MLKAVTSLVVGIAFVVSAAVQAEEHIIEGVVTQWRPLVTFAQLGDTVRFKNMTGHDTATMEGLIPEGGTPWQSQLGEEGYSVTLDKEGAWIYKCTPHISTGMVGVIVVGDARPPANIEQLQANLPNVKVGRNMVNRAMKKMDQAFKAEGK